MQNRGIWLTFKCLEMDKHLKIILDMYMHIDFLNNCIETKLIKKKKSPSPLEKEMATCSSILAWRIPWTEEPGKLQSMGSQELDTLSNYTTTTTTKWIPSLG